VGIVAGALVAASIEGHGFGAWLRSVRGVCFFLRFIPVLVVDACTKPLLQNVEEDVGVTFLWVWWRNYRTRAAARAASRRAQRAAARTAAATKTSL